MKKLHFLQALRAWAAWLVVADHAILSVTTNATTPVVAEAWRLGESGVELFFVISGFIMTHISWNEFDKPQARRRFVMRRLVRIVPLYWLATILALVYHRFSATHDAHAGVAALIKSLFFIPYHDDAGAWRPVLPQGWTLSYEMMFYAIFAIGLTFRRNRGILFTVGALLILIGTQPLITNGSLAHLAAPISLWFVLGIGLGFVWRHLSLSEPHWLKSSAALFEPFGDASYSTYLVHGVVLTVLLRCWTRLGVHPGMIFVPAALVIVTIAGWAVHRLVEKPLLRVLHYRRASQPAAPPTGPQTLLPPDDIQVVLQHSP
jgi:exopolysaccharide production protein ExoZ